MALQFTGQYDLETPANTVAAINPSPPPGGAEGTSFSCWIQVAAGTVNVNTNLFSALNAAGLGFQATNELYQIFEGSGGNWTYDSTLSFGIPLLVVGTCTTSKQEYYINDNIPASNGSLTGGPLSTATNIKLGVSHPSTSPPAVIISQPAFYDYVLTSADILNLLLGNANPLNTGSASLSGGAATWFATLAGTTGHAPQLGDTGLANSGTLGAGTGGIYTISTLNPSGGTGSAQYVADLAYTPPVTVTAYVESAGTLVFFFLANLSGVSQSVQTVNANPTIYVNGALVTVPPYSGPVWCDQSLQCPWVAYQLPSPVSPSDVVTYTIPGGAFSCAAGFCGAVSSPTVATNYVGQYEPGLGGKTSFEPNPSTMKIGVNHDYINFTNGFGWSASMNARYRLAGVVCWNGGYYSTYDDTTGELLTFQANVVNPNSLYESSQSNLIDTTTGMPSPIGRYSIVFDDVNASTWTSNYAGGDKALHVWINCTQKASPSTQTGAGHDAANGLEGVGSVLNGTVSVTNGQAAITFTNNQALGTGQVVTFSTDAVNSYAIETGGVGKSFSLTSNFAGTTSTTATCTQPSTFTRTVSGTTVTVTYDITYPYVPNYSSGYNLDLNVCFKSSTGNWAANDPTSGTPTITNFWVFTPGDSLTPSDYPYFPNTSGNDRSDALAPSKNLVNWLTATNGAGPATLRCIASAANYGGCANFQNYADCVAPAQWNWNVKQPRYIPISYARFYNTNPSNGTYAWSSTKVYHPLLGGQGTTGGTDGTGPYIDLALAGAELDYGYYLCTLRSLSGKGSVVTGSPTVTMTASQTYWAGQPIIFPNQPTVTYRVATTTTGTSFTLTTTYTGGNQTGLQITSFSGGCIELVSTSPHGLRTGDYFGFPTSAIGPSYIPITGGYGTTLSGASVTYGSNVLTFASAVTIPTWGAGSGQSQSITFSSDPTGQAYLIGAALATAVAVTNGLETIVFNGTVNIGSGQQVWFAIDSSETMYTIATGGTGTTFSLTTAYTGPTSGTGSNGTTANLRPNLPAVTATPGSATITFASSVTLSTGQELSFSQDAFNTLYTIQTGGTGTSFTLTSAYTGAKASTTAYVNLVQTGTVFHITPAYLGTTSTTATATLCASVNTQNGSSMVVVTGPTTFVISSGAFLSVTGQQQLWQPLATFEMPMATPLLGTASVANGSASVTFSQSQSLTANGLISFGSDSAGTVYALEFSVNGTSATLKTPYVGTTSGTSTAYQPWAMSPASNGASSGLAPYAFFANLAAQWEGCALWIPLPPHMSTACLQQIADDMAPYLLEGATVICEEGDENWNTPFPLYAVTLLYGNLVQYVEPGVQLTNYFQSIGQNIGYVGGYCVTASQKHDILQARFDTWNKGIKVGRCISGQFGNPGVTQSVVNFCKSGPGITSPIPIGLSPVAPYLNPSLNGTNDATYVNWCSPSLGAATPTAFNAWFRHYLKYSTQFAACNAGQASALAAYTGPTGYACQVGSIPGNYTYEGNISYVILNTGVPALQKDSFYNPGFAGSWNAWAQALQDGGVNVTTLFTLGGEWGELWSAVLYQQQQPGDGSTNLYTSDQAGGDGYSHDYQNTSVELAQLRNWIAGANSSSGSSAATLSITEAYDARAMAATAGSAAVSASMAVHAGADNARLLAGGALGITRVSPSKIQPNTSSSVTLTLLGSGTSWTSGSTVTINNSVVGTTTVTAGTLTVISGTHATLAVTTGTGAGTYTITLGGATSPNLVVGSKTAGWHPGMSRRSRTARAAS